MTSIIIPELIMLLTLILFIGPELLAKKPRPFLWIVGITIVAYRLSTFMDIYFWGHTPAWNTLYTDSWNHYQLGLLLLLVSQIPFKLIQRYKILIRGLGTGMILDEVSDIIKLLFPHLLPEHFRDSLPDLFLIIVTFLIFSLSYQYLAAAKRHS